jgi:hypothetical protein
MIIVHWWFQWYIGQKTHTGMVQDNCCRWCKGFYISSTLKYLYIFFYNPLSFLGLGYEYSMYMKIVFYFILFIKHSPFILCNKWTNQTDGRKTIVYRLALLRMWTIHFIDLWTCVYINTIKHFFITLHTKVLFLNVKWAKKIGYSRSCTAKLRNINFLCICGARKVTVREFCGAGQSAVALLFKTKRFKVHGNISNAKFPCVCTSTLARKPNVMSYYRAPQFFYFFKVN